MSKKSLSDRYRDFNKYECRNRSNFTKFKNDVLELTGFTVPDAIQYGKDCHFPNVHPQSWSLWEDILHEVVRQGTINQEILEVKGKKHFLFNLGLTPKYKPPDPEQVRPKPKRRAKKRPKPTDEPRLQPYLVHHLYPPPDEATPEDTLMDDPAEFF